MPVYHRMRFATTLAGALTLYAGFTAPARADLANGESIVRNICASCHGFPPLGGPERAAGNPALIKQAITSLVPSMFFLRGVLTDADINDVAAYLLSLQAKPTPSASFQGLWLGTPLAAQSGWGINFTQQGTALFATWFTYDADGSGMWLVMSDGTQTSVPGIFHGTLLRTTGPGFNAQPFTAIGASNYTPVGNLTVTFFDPDNGTMTYTVNGVTQTRPIARFLFAPPPTCTIGGTAGATPNYTDLWWHDATESGWGVNIVHQGNILFATWFTYEAGGTAANPAKGMWLVMSQGDNTGPGVYTGVLQRTTGPNPFTSSGAFDPNLVQRTTVGNATFRFTDANTGTFTYTVNGITQTKTIQRLAFSGPPTVCK